MVGQVSVNELTTSDSSLTHLFHCRTSRQSWLFFMHDSLACSYDMHGCTRAFTTRYTTVDATVETWRTSATVE